MRKELVIEVYGVYFDVVGYYHKGEERTYDYCGSPSEFEIENIKVNDIDLYDVLCDKVIEIINDKCLDQVNNM